MAGEHILKLLYEPDARLAIGDKWMIRYETYNKSIFVVYQRKRYARKTLRLVETEDEKLACKILKEE